MQTIMLQVGAKLTCRVRSNKAYTPILLLMTVKLDIARKFEQHKLLEITINKEPEEQKHCVARNLNRQTSRLLQWHSQPLGNF